MYRSPPPPLPTTADLRDCLDRLRGELLTFRTPDGHWEGELSASALSTATAISALSAMVLAGVVESPQPAVMIRQGLRYLDSQQNADGGYGDTDRSHSNIATSYLVLAARTLAARTLAESGDAAIAEPDATDPLVESMSRLNGYLDRAGRLDGLRRRYGRDKTFVVPILTNLAIAGLVDWKQIPRLPFEAAIFPGAMYRFLRMPVVSYAIPALVAIGQAHHFCGPPAPWPLRTIRSAAVGPTMRVLQRMQPDSGGYLEATPLTSFVLMSLAASGRGSHPVSLRCLEFLQTSIRPDGSWPIDTNLATWVTSLAIHALAQDPQDDGRWATAPLIDWHLGCQHQTRHPFTGADPGGWGWTDLSGAVPDGDDTPAAVLAIADYLTQLESLAHAHRAREAASRGIRWLLKLQNRDGGLPTFCRGWGKLPFDRSSTDLTAHLIRALDAVPRSGLMGLTASQFARSRRQAIRFLLRNQQPDGHWKPLWFGNQDHPDEENPVYGTSRVLLAIADDTAMTDSAARATEFLLQHQNADGGWGGGPSVMTQRGGPSTATQRGGPSMADQTEDGPITDAIAGAQLGPRSSLEETAVAVEALVAAFRATPHQPSGHADRCEAAILAGCGFLTNSVASGLHREPWPIGFYFAKLWYHERLYPIVFTMAALGAALRWLPRTDPNQLPANPSSKPIP
ncbi:MAG: squalene--hopene cyclase [Planctomycetaceae bacterium]|nr:MAG: squalene--hopene cyclase [Planctomycetaceae bacterium]